MKKLSKTNYLVYRDCAHNAWVKVHKPEIYHAVSLSVFEQAIIEVGNDVDVRARELFPDGILVRRGDAVGTAELVAARAPVIYQPVFETDRYTTACDILAWNAATGAYDLYEVKASTSGEDRKAKDDLYAHDIAFQALVLQENGVPLGGLHLVRLNGEYVSDGKLDLNLLFTREDFTDRVTPLLAAVRAEMDAAHDLMQLPSRPAAPCTCIYKGRSSQCTTFSYINTNVPDYSVHDLTRIGASPKKLKALVDDGILAITDVPDEFELTVPQRNQVAAAKRRRPSVELDPLAAFLDEIHYPIAFLDYETYPCALPRFAGYGPFNHVPFQFSLHVVKAPGGDAVHHEFLFTEATCPDAPFVAALKAALPAEGSIIVWNKPFEKGINAKLAERLPAEQSALAAINDRVIDLMDVFTEQMLVHPGFRGKTSIKWVLPALVPGLSYKGLAIQEGATASETWNSIVTGELEPAEAAEARKNLLTYCGLDSLAMVEIWRALLATVAARELREAG
ncbi:DUF2779 domain-containing protein [Hyphomicrobium sp. LHD-15]|uniref:DUF2779 domain-containing protein n=1 Tax=Hyphomicrobium sp. LHD-15 TaxID=3072142 RepID=UPI00280EB277|nr:DUF2779 domain-containing protein [Hyphomicrobium sp. LHD-15]MDQ8698355.1 DUF2779 domain-containing protein [Hyphomicrobium sp. LHD-15]